MQINQRSADCAGEIPATPSVKLFSAFTVTTRPPKRLAGLSN